MKDKSETKIVTVDDGSGPVKAAKDAYGRLLSKEQVQAIRDKHQADLDQVTQVRDKLTAKDEAARADVGRFIKPAQLPSIALWGQDFFLDRLDKLRAYL